MHKKISILCLVLLLILSMTMTTGCKDEDEDTWKININGKDLVVGKEVFEVNISVRNMTSEKVKFMVRPHADDFGYNGEGEISGPNGVWGTSGAFPGKLKGDTVELDGTVTLYAYGESGPSVQVTMKGTYKRDELDNNTEIMPAYIFDGSFTRAPRSEVVK